MPKLTPAALAALALASSMTLGAHAEPLRKTYIVQLKDEPAVTYKGGVKGLAATAPSPGQAFDTRRPEVSAYLGYLRSTAGTVAATVATAPILATYDTVFNGFAARLTDGEARQLLANPQVAGLWADRERHLDTISTAKFLGLSTPGGLWSKGPGGSALKGEDMVIGVVDGGIWPENPAFFDHVDSSGAPSRNPNDVLAYGPVPASFKGTCQAGEGFTVNDCNNKLVGARYFRSGFEAFLSDASATQHWTEFASPRDSLGYPSGHGGHGDHTASTAAGNSGVNAIIGGNVVGSATGMAPRARVAAYKVCWTYDNPQAPDFSGSSNSCWDSDSVAAIDTAVKDGVNAINFSISGSETSINEPVEQAFYRAALSGVFVAAAAGNDGPANAVAHLSPWLTTVAASTHDRGGMAGSVTLGNGSTYVGGSTTATGLPAAPLVRAEDSGLNGQNAALCNGNADISGAGNALLDPAKVRGKIVVCIYSDGEEDLMGKSQAVLKAGGIGMILMNSNGNVGVYSDYLAVPTVHLNALDGGAIRAYAKLPGATASIAKAAYQTVAAPTVIYFSSRGPNMADANVLKPDLSAPGVNVIAQVTPGLSPDDHAAIVNGTLVPPPAWDSMDGTSMATPHVAGVSLLLKQAHPDWSPAAIKSALMTTGYMTLDDFNGGMQAGQLPWGQGAGHIDPLKANDPGLVYDAGRNDWIKYQCKINRAAIAPASDCSTIGTFSDTYELNLPSITAGTVLKDAVIPRTVTNVGNATATYRATIGVDGFSSDVTPSVLTLAPGASGTFTVKLTPATAVEGDWHYGELVWTDGTHRVRSPVQARVGAPVQVPAADFTGTTVSGSRVFTVRTGFSGKLQTRVGGMKEVTLSPEASAVPGTLDGSLLQALCRDGVTSPYHTSYTFNVPADTIVARFALRAVDVSNPRDDNDLAVVLPDNSTLFSGSSNSDEAIQLMTPTPGTYKVCVGAYAGVSPMKHRLSSWIVGAGEGSSLKVLVPAAVYAGGTASLGLSWSGLAAGTRYVGGVQYLDPNGRVAASNAVRVDTDGAVQVLNDAAPVAPAKLAKAAKATQATHAAPSTPVTKPQIKR